jgi:hypothetical protein
VAGQANGRLRAVSYVAIGSVDETGALRGRDSIGWLMGNEQDATIGVPHSRGKLAGEG